MLQRVIIHHRSESYQSGSVFTLNGLVSEKKKGELAFSHNFRFIYHFILPDNNGEFDDKRLDLIEITFKSSVHRNRLKAFFEVS